MKRPDSDVHYATEDHDWIDGDACAYCFEVWPCTVWRKWTASKDYKILQLQSENMRFRDGMDRLFRELDAVKDTVHRLDLLVFGGLFPQMGDIAKDGRGGNLSVSETVDETDVTPAGWGMTVTVPGRREFVVEYEANDGSVWRNKDIIERRYRKS